MRTQRHCGGTQLEHAASGQGRLAKGRLMFIQRDHLKIGIWNLDSVAQLGSRPDTPLTFRPKKRNPCPAHHRFPVMFEKPSVTVALTQLISPAIPNKSALIASSSIRS